jgi:methylmalonyl-CoA mutase
MTMEIEKLLDEFPPVSTEAWERAIRADLKGEDYAKKLIWQTAEGLAVKPYYRAEDLKEQLGTDAGGRDVTALRQARFTGDWRIREEIDAADPAAANRAALSAIAAGAEEIAFLRVMLRNASDVRSLCANLPPIPLHFENADEPVIGLLLGSMKSRHELSTVSTGCSALESSHIAASVIHAAPTAFVPFMIHGEELEERGATAVEEIGYTLAAGIEFLREMQARQVEIDRAAESVAFSFSIGSTFFVEIAKFRAFRSLWATVVKSFGGSCAEAKARIHARTSRWNKTIYDPHVNILRATTEAMSAVLGGVDSICVAPFDESYKAPDEASRRLARNVQLILKREAMLGRVADPAAGSYCLEVITDLLARRGWELMQKIEAAGGYTKACVNGSLNDALREPAAVREKAVVSRRRVFTGTNQYANPAEKVLKLIEPLRTASIRRGAEAYERLRLRTELHTASTGKCPHVLLAQFGDATMRAARSNFAANVFACAGFGVVMRSFGNADEIAAFDADLIVLCSSDSEYLSMVGELARQLQERGSETPIVVAGNPESAEELRVAGVADFIHIRSTPIEVLTRWQQRLGIKG